jgi:peptidoglycan hydrolase-like protein with peptidoglycan-binding domain
METRSSSNSFFIVAVIIVVIIAAVLFFVFSSKKAKAIPESNTDNLGKKITWTDDDFPLIKGSTGIRVKQLQAGLNIIKNNNLAIDGKFGEKTLSALKEGYNIESLSEANYNTYIKPNITKINDYINQSHPANASAGKSGPSSLMAGITGKALVNVIGKSISSTKNFQGFTAKADSDLEYIMDENKPVNYTNGQYIGVVEKEDNGWLRCVRSNGTRVFVLKNSVKI